MVMVVDTDDEFEFIKTPTPQPAMNIIHVGETRGWRMQALSY